MELHGGSIRAESEGEGKGAAFIVMLPVPSVMGRRSTDRIVSDETVRRRPIAESPELKGIRVMLVEDDPDARRLLRRIVEECGAVATDVESVSAALDTIDAAKPNILVSDLGMPGADGYELIKELCARGHSAQTLPAVALTAFARPEDRRRALIAGFQVRMSKPVDPHELTNVIATLVGRGGSRS